MTLILFSLFIVSCATGYHSHGLGGGYEDLKLTDDTYMVTFKGNGYTSQDRAFKYALRRCAELSKENGYNYFTVLNSSSALYQRQYITPIESQTNTTYSSSVYGNYGYANSNSTTTYTGGNVHIIAKPYVSITIKMYREPVPHTLNADAILSNFQSK